MVQGFNPLPSILGIDEDLAPVDALANSEFYLVLTRDSSLNRNKLILFVGLPVPFILHEKSVHQINLFLPIHVGHLIDELNLRLVLFRYMPFRLLYVNLVIEVLLLGEVQGC